MHACGTGAKRRMEVHRSSACRYRNLRSSLIAVTPIAPSCREARTRSRCQCNGPSCISELWLNERAAGDAPRASAVSRATNRARSKWCFIRACQRMQATRSRARQMHGGFGGMLSMRFKGGESAAIASAAACRSGSERRHWAASKAWSSIDPASRAGGSPCLSDLLRFSVGLEDVGDLIADIEKSLPAA
jgi:hypothetical protein